MALSTRKAKLDEILGAKLSDISSAQMRELLLVLIPVVALAAALIWLAFQFVQPAPPRKITISTASQTGNYFMVGTRYAEILKKSGVTLEVRTSAGSSENVARLKDPNSGVQVALLQGGTTNSSESPSIVSLGRIYLEPMWVFHRLPNAPDRLSALKGLRIAIGPEGSGTRNLALAVLKPYGVDAANTQLLPLTANEALKAMSDGALDAAFFTAGANAPLVQTLLRSPGVKVMSLAHAEALTRQFPFLSRIVLPQGAIDLAANIPEVDVQMVAPMAALVARDDLHPALVGLLVEAAKEVHKPGGMFQTISEFPKALDPELEFSEDAERAYKSGPSLLKRLLPFWMAIFIERMSVLVVPIVGLLIPLVKGIPALYRWRIRRRLLYWYGRLKALEATVAQDRDREMIDGYREEIQSIDAAVSSIPIPVGHSEEYYSLRSAIDLVRQRLGDPQRPRDGLRPSAG